MPITLAALNIVYQSDLESKAYALDLSNWGLITPLTSIAINSVIKMSDNTNVTTTVVAAGSATASGTTITLPRIKSLTLKEQYKVRVTFIDSGNTWEASFLIDCVNE
jgi:hypothetical protein